jgi:hypothetical protein
MRNLVGHKVLLILRNPEGTCRNTYGREQLYPSVLYTYLLQVNACSQNFRQCISLLSHASRTFIPTNSPWLIRLPRTTPRQRNHYYMQCHCVHPPRGWVKAWVTNYTSWPRTLAQAVLLITSILQVPCSNVDKNFRLSWLIRVVVFLSNPQANSGMVP